MAVSGIPPLTTLDPARQKLARAATEMEALFYQVLLKTLRGSSESSAAGQAEGATGGGLFGGKQAGMFADLFDAEIARGVAGRHPQGLAAAIYRQMESALPAAKAGADEAR